VVLLQHQGGHPPQAIEHYQADGDSKFQVPKSVDCVPQNTYEDDQAKLQQHPKDGHAVVKKVPIARAIQLGA
jgi:hypothetical protein